MKSRFGIVVVTLVFASQLCMADSRPTKVCVVWTRVRTFVPEASGLAHALSRQTLHGNAIDAVALKHSPYLRISDEAQNAGCGFLVTLSPSELPKPIGYEQFSRSSGGPFDSGAPPQFSPDAPILRYQQPGIPVGPFPSYRSFDGLNFPSVNYTLTKVGTTKPIARGSQIAARNYTTDYYALARKIAHNIK